MLPRQGHTADVIDDYLYIFGGYDLNIVLYSFKRLYIPSGNWSDVPINSECAARLPQGVLSKRELFINCLDRQL